MDEEMKKIIMFLIIGVLLFGMMACDNNAEVANEEASVQQEQFEFPTGPFNEKDMIFVHNRVTYPISTDVTPLLQLFGSEYEEITAPSCAFAGEDKQFVYDYAKVYTYPMEAVDMINEIYIYGGEYKTSRGIGMGSTLEEVKATYGDGGFEQGSSYVYVVSGSIEDTTSQKLYFELIDGVVSGISYFGANGIIQ